MKIVCDNCATKYSIADEKVRGKVFKIRCKKCSHIIVVRGGEGAAAQEAPGAAADGGFPDEQSAPAPAARGAAAPASLGTGEAVWHLVVDREQIGPLTREEVHTKFRAGEVDLETYAWREGFGDWLRLGSIDDFRDLAGDGASAPAASHGEGPTRRTDTADLFATGAPAPQEDGPAASDLFAAHNSPSAPTGEAPMPANEIFGQAGGALFGAPSTAAAAPVAAAPAARPTRTSSPGFSGGGAMAASAEAPADSAGNQKMTGQRNENSVLFSLNNLQALASGGGGGGAAPAAKSSAEPRPGFANAQTEGSGLIDIRAMAASTLASGPTGSAPGKSDEPAFASAPLFSPMAAPILMPAPASGPPKWIWALLAVGVLAVAGVGILIVLIATKKPEPPVVATVTPVAPTAGNPNVVTPVANPAAPTAPAAAGNPVVAAANPAATPKNDEPKAEHHPKDHAAKSPKEPKATHETAAAVAAPVAAAPVVAAPPPKKGGKKDELDDLLNNASPDKPAPKHSAPREDSGGGGDSNLPDQLDKAAIVGGMSKVKPKVADCYVQFKVPGLANVSVTIGKSGHVSSATVSGSFSGTPTGSCVEKAVKGAGFPPFKGSPQTINYPFMLR